MDKTSYCKVGVFCRLFFAKEERKAFRGKPDWRELVDWFFAML